MPAADPIREASRLSNQSLYAWLVQFPAVCFTGALITDVVYWKAPQFLWQTFSVWLLAVGCLMAGIAGVVGLVCFCRSEQVRRAPFAWPHALLSLLAAVLSVFNAFVHSRDGYTAVVPEGLTLSTVVVVLMGVVTCLGWTRPVRTVRAGASA